MKKTILVLFILLTVLLGTACGDESGTENSTTSENSADSGAVSVPEPEEEKVSSEDSEESVESTESSEPEGIAYEMKQVRTQCGECDHKACDTLISTKADLDLFYETHNDYYSFDNAYGLDEEDTFKNLIADYDEAFFENHDLIIVAWESGSGSNNLKVEKIYFSDEGVRTLNAVIDEYNPNTFFDSETSQWYITETCDIAQHFMCIAIDKAHKATDAVLKVTVK